MGSAIVKGVLVAGELIQEKGINYFISLSGEKYTHYVNFIRHNYDSPKNMYSKRMAKA